MRLRAGAHGVYRAGFARGGVRNLRGADGFVPGVLVAGGANVDVKVQAGGPIGEGISTPGRVRVVPGGVARNVAEVLARLGARVQLASVVGADAWGTWLIARTAAAGVDVSAVVCRRGRTGIYVTVEGCGVADTGVVEAAPPSVWRHLPLEDADLVVLDANPAPRVLRDLARRARRLALVGTSPAKVVRLRSLLPRTWLLCLTEAEACALLGAGAGHPREAADLARAVQVEGPQAVLITLGQGGLGLLRDDWTMTPAYPARVVNATGAGDTAAGVVLFGLLTGWTPRRLLPRAALAAALTVRIWGNVHPGVGTVLVGARRGSGGRRA
ncbi:MAG: PfkB family carbohydrate kinase [Armatimonadota bacterium]|nr:PfkB family carbohydrate kinase [Armatimonadota bacterium]MDR7468784.1 PfkB family carbohydrate kinase [Armatimonadota bacterium]